MRVHTHDVCTVVVTQVDIVAVVWGRGSGNGLVGELLVDVSEDSSDGEWGWGYYFFGVVSSPIGSYT
jgi:hypothetical protein